MGVQIPGLLSGREYGLWCLRHRLRLEFPWLLSLPHLCIYDGYGSVPGRLPQLCEAPSVLAVSEVCWELPEDLDLQSSQPLALVWMELGSGVGLEVLYRFSAYWAGPSPNPFKCAPIHLSRLYGLWEWRVSLQHQLQLKRGEKGDLGCPSQNWRYNHSGELISFSSQDKSC